MLWPCKMRSPPFYVLPQNKLQACTDFGFPASEMRDCRSILVTLSPSPCDIVDRLLFQLVKMRQSCEHHLFTRLLNLARKEHFV
jgi:hypothetical protein